MKRDDAALGEHDQCAADLRAAAVEGVAERGLRKLGAPRQLLLYDGGDDPVENRVVGRRLAEVVRRSRYAFQKDHRSVPAGCYLT